MKWRVWVFRQSIIPEISSIKKSSNNPVDGAYTPNGVVGRERTAGGRLRRRGSFENVGDDSLSHLPRGNLARAKIQGGGNLKGFMMLDMLNLLNTMLVSRKSDQGPCILNGNEIQ